MASGGQKRTRSERVAALEIRPGKWERAWANLRRRDVLLRLSLTLLTAVGLCLVIQGWRPPFSYRIGYVPPRDITARVPFSLPDRAATDIARVRARSQVRYVYSQDAEPLIQLRGALRNSLLEVMRAAAYADVKPETWAEFRPPPDAKGDQPLALEMQSRFEKLRKALQGDENLASFEKALATAMAPFEQHGLLETLPQQLGDGNQDEIVVYPGEQLDAQKIVKVSDVLIGDATAIRESLRKHLPSAEVADIVFDWLRPRLKSTLDQNRAETQKALDTAAAAVKEVLVNYEPGQTLAPAGQPIRMEQWELLRQEHQAAMAQRTAAQKATRSAAVTLMILILFGLSAVYLYDRERRLMVSLRRLGTLLFLLVLTVVLASWASDDAWRAEIIPLLLFGQTVAIAYGRELALLLSGATALIIVVALGPGLGGLLVLLGVTAVSILQLARIRNRTKLIYVGFTSGVAAFLLSLVVTTFQEQPMGLATISEAARVALWTLAAGFLMTGLLPFIESLFGVLTDISLLELGDVSHPLLQELVQRAPSTYNHSITVGSIAEAAADAIGGRGLLVRVGAYFHDIGKMLKPEYFIENQSPNDNRHESLIPAMSTLVIIAHVKDGGDLARQHRLPEPIIDLIEQHHGTTLVEYFFGRASEQSLIDPNGGEVDESSFRYPGPRPQTKEACVLMLADSAESACRSLVEPTPARIESLVRDIAERKLDDGQFDECNLTLRELRTIENNVIKSLIANYHGRIKYPDQKTA
jgi:putative nucleotidyltransferase with HDIG domain